MSFYFKPEKTYSFGVRKVHCQNTSNVEYSRPNTTFTYLGSRMIEQGMETFEDYLRQNPNKFKQSEKITVTEVVDGYKVWRGEGNPYPPANKPVVDASGNVPASLADNGTAFRQAHDVVQASNKAIEKNLSNEIRLKNEQIADLQRDLHVKNERIFTLETELFKSGVDLKGTVQELKLVKKEYEDFKNRFGGIVDKGESAEGLADMAGAVLSNPAIQGLLSLGGQWLASKMGGGGNANGQAPAQNGQAPQQQGQFPPVQNGNMSAIPPDDAAYSLHDSEVFVNGH